ncbi:synaptonemal complex central element protein 1-like isoform X2 [Antedon mediterranea]
MADGAIFKLDVIYNSIKDSQAEKTQNEERLAEARKTRLNLEHQFESVASKHTQLLEIHNQMQKTSKVGQYKVAQTQSQINSQEVINKEIQDKLKKLENLIEKEQNSQQFQREEYEKKLSAMEQVYRDAYQNYREDSLALEISQISKTKDNLSEKIGQSDTEMDKLRKLIEGLSLKEDEIIDQDDIDEQKQILLHSMFQANLKSKNEELVKIQQNRLKIEQELTQLSEWKPPSDLMFVLKEDQPSLQV